MFPDHHSNVKFNNPGLFKFSQDFKAFFTCSAPKTRIFSHLCPQHARPIRSNGVNINDSPVSFQRFLVPIPYISGTISYFSEIATSFPTILRGYIVTFFFTWRKDSLPPPPFWYIPALYAYAASSSRFILCGHPEASLYKTNYLAYFPIV